MHSDIISMMNELMNAVLLLRSSHQYPLVTHDLVRMRVFDNVHVFGKRQQQTSRGRSEHTGYGVPSLYSNKAQTLN